MGEKDGDNSDGTCPNYSGTSPRKTFGTFGEGERFKNKLAVDLTNRLSITFKAEWPVWLGHSRWRIPNGLDRRC